MEHIQRTISCFLKKIVHQRYAYGLFLYSMVSLATFWFEMHEENKKS